MVPASPGADEQCTTTIGAVVLAGGRSSRMGRAKAWLRLGTRPLLAHVVALVRPLVSEVVVVAARGQRLPPVDARIVRDRAPDQGPLPALALGLATVAADAAFALGCDGPFVRPEVLGALRTGLGAREGLVPTWDDRHHPLVAIYRQRLAARLDALVARGERRLGVVATLPGVASLSASDLAAVDPNGVSFRMLNTPAEYRAACARWASESSDDA